MHHPSQPHRGRTESAESSTPTPARRHQNEGAGPEVCDGWTGTERGGASSVAYTWSALLDGRYGLHVPPLVEGAEPSWWSYVLHCDEQAWGRRTTGVAR